MNPGDQRRSFSSRTPSNDHPDRVTYRRGFITRHQVTGWRFVMRRIASGLALHDTRMLVDPLRTQSRSVTMGALIVITGLAGCFVFSLLHPEGAVGTSAVLADRDSSALYVRVSDQLHPVLNLTSARLITGRAATPKVVSGSALDEFARGPMVGIPGAPERMVQNDSRDPDWTVCDAVQTSTADYPGVTVIGGTPVAGGARATALPPGAAVLVVSGSPEAPSTWLLWNGHRSRIDLADRAVTDALGLPVDPAPRSIAPGLFNAIPEGPPLVVPVIPGAGEPPSYAISIPVVVGAVLAAFDADGTLSYYAVLPDGLQPVSKVLAAVLRNSNSYGLEQPPHLGADEVARLPVSQQLDTTGYPDRRLSLIEPQSGPVTCAQWSKPAGAMASSLTLLTGATLPIRDGDHPVELPAEPGRLAAERVVLPVGTGYFAQTVGSEPTSPPAGSLFWISDTGVRYGIEAANSDESAATVAALGLTQPATPVPWPILVLLTPGPALSQADALMIYSGTERR